ncbi:MAG: sodium:solute symporter family protein [Bacteriovoracaceae bacterium]
MIAQFRAPKDNTLLEHLLMGRRLTLPLFVATLVSTWYGGIFGVASIAFESGIYNFITQGVFWYVAYLIFAFFILKKIHKYQAMTLPDLIGKMFGPRSEKVSAFFNVLNLVPVAYAISMGLIVQMFFPVTLNEGILIGVGFTLLYAMFGGFRAVVFSDLAQFFIMFSSVVGLFLFSVFLFGARPLESLPSSYFEPMGGHGVLETLVWGFIALSTLVDPNFYQRAFAANSPSTAKWGIVVATILWMIFDLSLTFGAMYAKALLPLAEAKDGYFEFAFKVLPQGFRGYFLAGIAATVLSTLDSYLFLAGSTLAYDLAPKRYRGQVWLHYMSFLFIAAVSILMATMFEGDIKAVWKTLGSLSAASLLFPVLYGYLSKRKLSDNTFVTSAITSAIIVISWRLFGFKDVTGIDELYVGVAVSLIVITGRQIYGIKR